MRRPHVSVIYTWSFVPSLCQPRQHQCRTDRCGVSEAPSTAPIMRGSPIHPMPGRNRAARMSSSPVGTMERGAGNKLHEGCLLVEVEAPLAGTRRCCARSLVGPAMLLSSQLLSSPHVRTASGDGARGRGKELARRRRRTRVRAYISRAMRFRCDVM